MSFSQRLKHLRKELNLTQQGLANSCAVKLTAISKYETEIIKPSFEMLSKLGLAYNVNLNWLVNDIGSMFIETATRKLIKDGTNNYSVEIIDAQPEMITVKTDNHSLELTSDLKVDYYDGNNENYTKIYRKTGEVEYMQKCNSNENLQAILQKIAAVCKSKNQFEFIMTAIDALEDENSLSELKTLIKGMELSKK